MAPRRPTPIAHPIPVARANAGYNGGPTEYKPDIAAFETSPTSRAIQSAASGRFNDSPKALTPTAETNSEARSKRRASQRAAATANSPQPAIPPRLSNTPPASPAAALRPAALNNRGVQLTTK